MTRSGNVSIESEKGRVIASWRDALFVIGCEGTMHRDLLGTMEKLIELGGRIDRGNILGSSVLGILPVFQYAPPVNLDINCFPGSGAFIIAEGIGRGNVEKFVSEISDLSGFRLNDSHSLEFEMMLRETLPARAGNYGASLSLAERKNVPLDTAYAAYSYITFLQQAKGFEVNKAVEMVKSRFGIDFN